MIDDRQYNEYLRKYEDRFSVNRATDKVWKIKCHKGNELDLWDVNEKLLCFSVFNCISKKGLNIYKKKFNKSGKWFKTTQEGDYEMLVIIKEKELDDLTNIILPIKRRKDYRNLKKVPTEQV